MIGTIHCDACGHKIPGQDVASWHLKPCPKCGEAPLISDADLEVAQTLDALMAAGFATQAPTDKPGVSIRINTAGLRK